MYNLLVGFREGTAWSSRVVEGTSDAIKSYISPAGSVDPSRLIDLPTLFMPELDSGSRQIARVGHVEDLTRVGDTYTYRFVPATGIREFSTDRIKLAAADLDIDLWEFTRTHWAIKNVDLHRVLNEALIGVRLSPRVFKFPTGIPQDPNRVSVMMPFSPDFDPMYEAIRAAAADAGMVCDRADNIWMSDRIMEDVIRLLWTARVVIADLTGRNPNVLYEAGIAHSLGRDTIQIAQSEDDIPFNLRGLRSVEYTSSPEGLHTLRTLLATRLRDLTSPDRQA